MIYKFSENFIILYLQVCGRNHKNSNKYFKIYESDQIKSKFDILASHGVVYLESELRKRKTNSIYKYIIL